MHFWGLFEQAEAQPQSMTINEWALLGFNLRNDYGCDYKRNKT